MSADIPRHSGVSELAGTPISQTGDPVWELASLFPHQGEWTEEAYLAVACQPGIELADGVLEFLPVPTEFHQILVAYLYDVIRTVVGQRGLVLFSGLRVQVRPGKIREPDVVLMLHENRAKRTNRFWRGADLAIEVVSEDDPQRDYESKRAEYAAAGIREYWIVDPRDESVTLLVLEDGQSSYIEAGRFQGDQLCQSRLLAELSLTPQAIFDRPERLTDEAN